MKIDKIVFSSSEKYSPFWNYQAKTWSKMGITPVLLLWGEVKNTDVKDTHGEVIEMKYADNAIKSLQMTWSKFFHTRSEPDTTWLIGDIDLFPLQANYFKERLLTISDDAYAHLAGRHQTKSNPTYFFDQQGSESTGGQNLPAYYHLAKGKTFDAVYQLSSMELTEYVNRIVSLRHGRNIPTHFKNLSPVQIAQCMDTLGDQHSMEPFWCADESYSSTTLWDACVNNKVKYVGTNFAVVDPSNPFMWNRIDRHFWNEKHYSYVDLYRLKSNNYIDLHCIGPSTSMDGKKATFEDIKESLSDILTIAGMI
jgi:hypothetical protein